MVDALQGAHDKLGRRDLLQAAAALGGKQPVERHGEEEKIAVRQLENWLESLDCYSYDMFSLERVFDFDIIQNVVDGGGKGARLVAEFSLICSETFEKLWVGYHFFFLPFLFDVWLPYLNSTFPKFQRIGSFFHSLYTFQYAVETIYQINGRGKPESQKIPHVKCSLLHRSAFDMYERGMNCGWVPWDGAWLLSRGKPLQPPSAF